MTVYDTHYTNEVPCPREFDCPTCGAHVVITKRSDRRMVFCSNECHRRYWRHPERYKKNRHDTGYEPVPAEKKKLFVVSLSKTEIDLLNHNQEMTGETGSNFVHRMIRENLT